MAFTRVLGPGIHTQSNINSHNIKSTGIITAVGLDIDGPVSIAGTLTYQDVTNIDSVGLITARKGIISSGVVTATAFHGSSQVGIQSGGVQIGAGITQLNFVGTGNTFAVNGTTVDISIQGGGGGGAFTTSVTGVQTSSSLVGIGTTTTDDADLQGIGNTAKGLYISNGMMIMDNSVHGDHYIGTNFNGLMVGPVNINGTITVSYTHLTLPTNDQV